MVPNGTAPSMIAFLQFQSIFSLLRVDYRLDNLDRKSVV